MTASRVFSWGVTLAVALWALLAIILGNVFFLFSKEADDVALWNWGIGQGILLNIASLIVFTAQSLHYYSSPWMIIKRSFACGNRLVAATTILLWLSVVICSVLFAWSLYGVSILVTTRAVGSAVMRGVSWASIIVFGCLPLIIFLVTALGVFLTSCHTQWASKDAQLPV